jgi:hypothetical protein
MWEEKGRTTDEADDTDENLECPDMFASARCRLAVAWFQNVGTAATKRFASQPFHP